VVEAMEEGWERRSGSSSELVYFSVYFGFVLRLGSISDLYILVLLKRQLVWVLYSIVSLNTNTGAREQASE
jgi:hypothetical protein